MKIFKFKVFYQMMIIKDNMEVFSEKQFKNQETKTKIKFNTLMDFNNMQKNNKIVIKNKMIS